MSQNRAEKEMTLSGGFNEKTSPHGGVPTGNTSSTALYCTSSGAMNVVNEIKAPVMSMSDFSSEIKVHISKSPVAEDGQESFLPNISQNSYHSRA